MDQNSKSPNSNNGKQLSGNVIFTVSTVLLGLIAQYLGLLPAYFPQIVYQSVTCSSQEEQKTKELFIESQRIAEEANTQWNQFGDNGLQKISELNRIKAKFQDASKEVNIITSEYPKTCSSFKRSEDLWVKYNEKIELIEIKKKEIREECPTGDGISRLGTCLD